MEDPYDHLSERVDEFGARQADTLARKPRRTLLKWTLWSVVICLGVSAVGSVVANATGIVSIYWQAEAAKITAKPRVTQQIFQTNNIIAQVDKFHRLCTNVQKDLNIYRNNEERYQGDLRVAQLQTDPLQRQVAINALTGEQQDATAALDVAQTDAADYDSASAQYTQTPFKDAGLPFRIALPAGQAAAAGFTLNCN